MMCPVCASGTDFIIRKKRNAEKTRYQCPLGHNVMLIDIGNGMDINSHELISVFVKAILGASGTVLRKSITILMQLYKLKD